MLLSIHAAAAGILKSEELALDKQEADALGRALLEVEAQYPTRIDPGVLAIVNLTGVAAMIYGPRIWAIRLRREGEKKARRSTSLELRTDQGGGFWPAGIDPEGLKPQ